MEALEELTPEKVKNLTKAEAKELYVERNHLITRLRAEMDLLRPMAWPPERFTQCPRCKGKKITSMPKGGYLCACGHRFGISEIIVGS